MFFQFDDDIISQKETVHNIQKWCKENLKNGEFIVGNTTIYIESEIDAMAFKLKWV